MKNGERTVHPRTVEEEKLQIRWHARVLLRALKHSSDVDEALRATQLALSIQPFPDESDIELEEEPEWDNGNDDGTPVDAAFAFDIFHKSAQGVLNRAMQATKKLAASARQQFEKILRESNPAEMARKIVAFVREHRVQLARLLGATQLASILEGAREAARHIPSLPPEGVIGPPPPSLPPDKADKLVSKLRLMTQAAREAELYKRPADEQNFIRRLLAVPPPEVPSFLPALTGEGPERILFPIIETAAKELAAKNLVTKDVFDRLDAATRQKAFTVAGVESQETLGKIRDVVTENIAEGADYASFRTKVLERVEEGTFLSEPHMEVVYRTNVQSQFSDGQMQVLQHPFVRGGFPYAVYDAIHDARARENHLALEHYGIDGTNVYRINDPVFQTFRPPWDYNDRCGWTAITIQQAAEMGIKEAQRWLANGVEPTPPAFVPMPPFRPPEGFQRTLAGFSLSVRLSMQSVNEFKKPEEVTTEELMGELDNMGQGNTVFTQPGDFTKESVSGAPSVDRKKQLGRVGRKISAKRGGKGKPGRRLHRSMRVSKKWKQKHSAAFAVQRAPTGYTRQKPLMIQGKGYVGGQFIPAEVMAKATPQEKAAIEGKTSTPKPSEAKKSPVMIDPKPISLNEWQQFKREENESGTAFFQRYLPELQPLGNNLVVDDPDSPTVRQHAYELARLPKRMIEALAKKGLKVSMGHKPMTDLDKNQHMKGVTPRGWSPNMSWDMVAGCYNEFSKEVCAGSGIHGAASLVLHETGHAIGDIFGFNNHPDLIAAHKRLFDKLPPYLQQEGPGGEAGRQELLAESLAIYMMHGPQYATEQFDAEHVAFLKAVIYWGK